ncbi:MAG TPA: glutamate synthase large subunit, partial [Alphaproteobacteria bacterium]|nr:glutamate synthase large subunit [Alphaproteobacteria bacterium]
VVVLGRTGRNFAAGMSGGVAYVFDIDGDFSSKCNLSMVALQSVKKEKNSNSYKGNGHFNDMTRFDEVRIKRLVERHLHYTNSNRAKEILTNWNRYLPNFVKIMPTDFQKALVEMKEKKPIHIKRVN